MCTALPLDEINPTTKYHNHSKYTFGDMHRTKIKYESKRRAITKKKGKQELWFMCTALPLMRSIHPKNFITIASIVLELCSRQNSSMNLKKRAITQNLGKQEFRFMCTALNLDEIYPPTKFHNHSLYSLGDMHRTKFKYEKKQKVITQRLSKQVLWFMCTALPLDEIYPSTKFYNHSKYSFGDMHRTKLKYESKQRAITKKKANKSYGSCALHSP